MHDIDRSLFELTEVGESEYEQEQESTASLEFALGEASAGETHETAELHEAQEIALASELLEVTNEAEMDRFLGRLLSSVGGAARQVARTDTGRALGGILKSAARKALPIVGRALGDRIAPGRGTDVARLATDAGRLFGLELEGLSGEDREFELARAFVRFGRDAARVAATAPRQSDPLAVARTAVQAAAKRSAPGLAPAGGTRAGAACCAGGAKAGSTRAGRGQWARQGRTIVLFNV